VPLLTAWGEVGADKILRLAQSLLLTNSARALAIRVALAMGEVVQTVRMAVFRLYHLFPHLPIHRQGFLHLFLTVFCFSQQIPINPALFLPHFAKFDHLLKAIYPVYRFLMKCFVVL
jgi:hypothetical protein